MCGFLWQHFTEIVGSGFPIAMQNTFKMNIDSGYYCVSVVMCLGLHHSNTKLSVSRVQFI